MGAHLTGPAALKRHAMNPFNQFLLVIAVLAPAAQAAPISLVTFGQAGPTNFSWYSLEDSVMGSQSYGNWTQTSQSGTLSGIVTIVPRPAVGIPHASPGFIKAVADGVFPDVSSEVAFLLLRWRREHSFQQRVLQGQLHYPSNFSG